MSSATAKKTMPTTTPVAIMQKNVSFATFRAPMAFPLPSSEPTRTVHASPSPYMPAVSTVKMSSMALCAARLVSPK